MDNRKIGSFARTFTSFYNPKEDIGKLGFISRWLFSARSVILIISMQTAIIAGILSYASDEFNILYFILLFTGFVLAHATSNLINDYFGYVRKHDTPDSPRLKYTIHPLANGVATKAQLAGVILALVFAGLIIAAYFTSVRGYLTLVFLLIGALFLLLYDVFPITLKSMGLGEIAAFIVWGPFMIGGGYYMITGSLALAPFLIAIPYGLGVMSILVGKHIDQIKFDRKIGQRTLPVMMGERNARKLNVTILIGMYVITAILALKGTATLFILLVFLNTSVLVSILKTFSEPKPSKAPKGYIGWPLWYHRASLKHNRIFGWIYIAGLLIGAMLPLFIV